MTVPSAAVSVEYVQDLVNQTATIVHQTSTVHVPTPLTTLVAGYSGVDGVSLMDGDRVLLKNQGDSTENDI